jgi:hypothetical protein
MKGSCLAQFINPTLRISSGGDVAARESMSWHPRNCRRYDPS